MQKFHNNPKAIQDWIDEGERYKHDNELFAGKFCDINDKHCDFWASALRFIRLGKGDCDEVLALSHYSLEGDGIGLFLKHVGNPSNKKDKNRGHAVYIYKGDNGFYGIISINKSEWEPPIYANTSEAALSYTGSGYNYYKFITFPSNNILLDNYGSIKKYAEFSEKFYFPKQ